MPSNSNALLRERTRSRPVETHPHAEVLAAFAQEKLLPGDSEKVLAHLSRCAECRALLRVTTSAGPELVEKTAPRPAPAAAAAPRSAPPTRGLPRLVTAAVLIGLGAAVMLYHRQSPAPETIAPEIVATSPQTEPPPGASPQTSDPGHTASPPSSKAQSIKAEPADTAHSSAHPTSAHPAPSQSSQAEAVTAGHPAASPPRASAGATAAPVRAKASADAALQLPENLDPSPGEPAQASQEAASVFPAPSTSAEGTSGEAVHPGTVGQRPGGATARAQWRIGDSGQVERSLGDGAWQQVFDPRAKLHVVAAVGTVVWAGGDDLHLYRSRDNGATWGRIELPVKDSGGSAIERIRFDNSREGTVESDTGNSWATTDGGSTWY